MSPVSPSSLAASASAVPQRRTVDAPVRVLHWLLALCVLGAYLTSEGDAWRAVHITLGYTAAGLLVTRLLWGLVGPRPARLSSLASRLSGWKGWVRSLRAGALPSGRLTQNLLLALTIVGLLALVALTTASGYAHYQAWWGEALEDVHEGLGNGLIAAVVAHVALVVAISVARRQNQLVPMLTGRSPGPGPDTIPHPRRGLAALILLAVLGFWGWQWAHPPVITSHHAAHEAGADHAADDDDD